MSDDRKGSGPPQGLNRPMPQRRGAPAGSGPLPPPLAGGGWGGASGARASASSSSSGASREGAPLREPMGAPPRPEAPQPKAAMAAHLDRFQLRLPQRRNAPPVFATAWFVVAFLIPMLFGSAYYGLIASKQYVSEFHFTVRQPLPDGEPQRTSGAQNGDLVALLGRSASASGAADTLDNYTVVDYIRSGQAARDLDQRLNLKSLYARQGVDPFSRYGGSPTAERLSQYWRRMIWATYDPATGLASVKVRAFRPEDAYAIATNLIDLSDGVINGIGRRSRADSLKVAQQEVDGAQARMTEVRNRLTALRNQLGAIDPTKDQVPGNTDLANQLRVTLTDQESQLAYLAGELKNPNAPQIAKLKAQIAATQAQLAGVDSRVTRTRVGGVALTAAVGEYEQLDAERRSVEQVLFQSLERLQQASVGADEQRLYLTAYVRPSTPDSSTYPKRLQSIGILALTCLMIWAIGVLLGKSVMDHIR